MAYRNYSDEDKAVALACYEACGNMAMAARECKVPVKTLEEWVKNPDAPSMPSAEFADIKKGELADKLEVLAHRIVDASAGKISGAPLAAAMTGLGIAVDKMRLLREQSTNITHTVSSVEERDAKLLDIMQKAKLRLIDTEKESQKSA